MTVCGAETKLGSSLYRLYVKGKEISPTKLYLKKQIKRSTEKLTLERLTIKLNHLGLTKCTQRTILLSSITRLFQDVDIHDAI